MRTLVTLTVSALAASLLLACAVSTTSASRLSISNQNIRATWARLEFSAVGVILRCQVTLEGSFHTRTIAKVARSLVGAITKARIKQETCTNGIVASFDGVERYNGATTPNTLPWHLTYERFAGTLPNITEVIFLFARFRFGSRDASALCTGQYGTAEDNISLKATRNGGGVITAIEPSEPTNFMTLSRRDAGVACPTSIEAQGPGTLMLLGTTTSIIVTLI